MRWDALFADMEMQLAAASAQDRDQAVAELTRAERAGVLLADRLRSARGTAVTLTVRTGTVVRGTLVDLGASWMLVGDGPREHLVPLGAVVSVVGLPNVAAPPGGSVLRRLGLGHALRAIARDRSRVRLVTPAGEVHGLVDAVGADHLDLAHVHEDSGRPTGQRQVMTFENLDVVSSL